MHLLLYSSDRTLHSLLASGLGADFTLRVDFSQERVKNLVSSTKCDVVILDLECQSPVVQFEFLNQLRDLGALVVIVTDHSRISAVELIRRGIQNYCQKPLAISELRIVIRRACEYANLSRELSHGEPVPASSSGCGELVGSAARSQIVYDMIRRVANNNAFVLITGESGTGKELIARAIHSLGNQKSHPFVAVSCGAIPDSLIESELFGSEKGSFTGASARRTGYFEEAGEGTLFLDEIGELSHHAQIKLLRVLQQREFMRLGSSAAIPLRARVLFATNRNLKQMVAEGTFREDLYYRLNVIGIHSQPLRNRRDDIPQLAQHFLAKYSCSFGRTSFSIKPDALALLCDYAWPGNVRELENVMQSAIILTDGDEIRTSSLPEELQRDGDLSSSSDALQWTSFEEQLRDYKTKLATEAVRECNGNKTLAAQSLNISRTYLHRLIREPNEEGPALRVA